MISKDVSKIAFIWGNGESRKKVDHMYDGFLEDLRMIGEFYGCNAIYRDHRMDHLVLVDPEMLNEISKDKSRYADRYPVWTGYRNPKQWGTKVKNIPKNHRWNAGTLATHLAIQHGNNEIYLIGHDLEPGANGLTNNCYKSTNNYRKVFEDDITYDRFFLDWKEMLTKCNGVNFYRVKSDSGFIPKDLKRGAMKHITWNAFVTKIKAYRKSLIFK
jgi:hypothetical protein